MGRRINTHCVLAALHCVQQSQGWCVFLGGSVWIECDVDVMCVCVNECKRAICAGSWPCSAQTQQLRLRLAEKKKKEPLSTHNTYCIVCLDLSLTPFPHLYSNTTLEDTASPLLSLSNYSCLPLSVNFSVVCSILFYCTPHFSASQQFISCSS